MVVEKAEAEKEEAKEVEAMAEARVEVAREEAKAEEAKAEEAMLHGGDLGVEQGQSGLVHGLVGKDESGAGGGRMCRLGRAGQPRREGHGSRARGAKRARAASLLSRADQPPERAHACAAPGGVCVGRAGAADARSCRPSDG